MASGRVAHIQSNSRSQGEAKEFSGAVEKLQLAKAAADG
jgi:hypothetical protein